jgi:hypothetical protein
LNIDDLIGLLVKDLASWRFRSILAGAVAGGIIIAATLFFEGIGFRPDISAAVKSSRFLFKFVVTISLAVTAIWVTLSESDNSGKREGRGTHAGAWQLQLRNFNVDPSELSAHPQNSTSRISPPLNGQETTERRLL